MLKRTVENLIIDRLSDRKVLILYGSRQVGKTTLFNTIQKGEKKTLWWNCDSPGLKTELANISIPELKAILKDVKLLFIDEAQQIENIGLLLKLIYDEIPEVKILVSGSSSFELANKINEPLTGRKWEFQLYPISFFEFAENGNLLEEKQLLQRRLVFGFYPEIINHQGNEVEYLNELSNSLLYKDILSWERIKKPRKLESLLQALAHQVGHQVSFNEIANLVGLDNQTVENYVSLLEKAFIIFSLPSLSRNLRNELKKSRKIYFFDNGLRNSTISSLMTLTQRQDKGQLWENFLISERHKYNQRKRRFVNSFFWRTTNQQEIDYVEEIDGKLLAFEFKWNEKKTPKAPKSFFNAYPNAEYKVITPENYLEFIYF